ncbi:MAG: hypothetical protein HWE16_02655 [Gammaproteobacteria bacterium]|nr:hypothetical protein [Gammaproteobacteria bacterium]
MNQLSFFPDHQITIPVDFHIPSYACPSRKMQQDDSMATEQALAHYRQQLWINAMILYMLEKEFGITNVEVLKLLNAGYCDRTLTKLFPKRGSLEGEAARGALVRQGILRPTGSETFRGQVTVELKDITGQQCGLWGFPMGVGKKSSAPSHILFSNVDMGVINHNALRKKHAVFYSNPLDAIKALCEGKNAVSLLGTMDSQDEFIEVLKNADISSAEVVHDHSPMGLYWAKQLKLALSQLEVEVKSNEA